MSPRSDDSNSDAPADASSSKSEAGLAIDNILLNSSKRGSRGGAPIQQQEQSNDDASVSSTAAANLLMASSGQGSYPNASQRGYPEVLQSRSTDQSGSHQHQLHLNEPKPVVGSDEWHRIRKDNHKEVERRRRETINKGIMELAKVVPGCDKHKGQILSQATEYIKRLKENEQHNLEKMTLEKLVTEQMIQDLSNKNKSLKSELEAAWKEIEKWKNMYDSKSGNPDSSSKNNS